MPHSKSSKELWILLSFYAIALFLLLPRLSLWLDEIIDLKAIRDDTLHTLIASVPINAGGVPLSYLARFATVHLLGYSSFSGRLPSAIFSLVGAIGIFVLARRLKLLSPLLAVLFFCITPLQWRYALESRPYSQALALSVWATVVFINLLDNPTFTRSLIYGLLCLAGLYTQPYMIFVPLSHFVWLCCVKRRFMFWAGIPIGIAAVGFLPWYFWATHLWNQSSASHIHYTIGIRTVPLILRELVGAGYLGTALTISAVLLGFRHSLPNRLFWAFYILLPIVLAVMADAVFGYFLAIRQMIFILAPLSLLTALGIERGKRTGAVFGLLLIAVFMFEDVHLFFKPRENWQSAAKILTQLSRQNTCLVFLPARSEELYRFFAPQLSHNNCMSQKQRSTALAISPYGGSEAYQDWLKKTNSQRFKKQLELNREGPKIEVYKLAY